MERVLKILHKDNFIKSTKMTVLMHSVCVCACHIRFQLHHWLVACCEKVVKIFNASIVKAAKESIPRGVRKDYKPYWSNEMQKTHDELTRAREKAETNSSLENNIKLH